MMPSSVSSSQIRSGQGRQVSATWRRLLRRISGYDPFMSAGNCEFDARTAKGAIDFFRRCIKHVKGAKARQGTMNPSFQRTQQGHRPHRNHISAVAPAAGQAHCACNARAISETGLGPSIGIMYGRTRYGRYFTLYLERSVCSVCL